MLPNYSEPRDDFQPLPLCTPADVGGFAELTSATH
jgi:hypothetical protein